MIHVTPNLNEKQICFCSEYLVNFNAYKSAIAAGYSENTARKAEILHLPKIQAYLKLKMQQRAERMEISHDMILREYAKIAFSSMGNYYDERGDLKPMCELSETEKAAISECRTHNIAEPDGYIIGRATRIKLHNKMAALDKIARHLGFFNQNQEARGGKEEVAAAVAVEQEVKDERLKEKGVFEEETYSEQENAAAAKLEAMIEEEEERAWAPKVSVAAFEETEDGLLRDRPVVREGGKILTLSPLVASDSKREMDVFMEELLLRGTDG